MRDGQKRLVGRAVSLCAMACLGGALGVTVVPTDAAAQAKPTVSEAQKKQKAIEAFKSAQKKFAAGDYAGALPLYKEAEATIPGARPKYQIAVCLDKLGRTDEAVKAYRTFIDSKPDKAKYSDEITEAGKRISALEAALPATVTIKVTPAGAQGVAVKVDGMPADGMQLSLAPGEHKVEVMAEGMTPTTETITVKANETRDLEVALTKAAPVPTPDPKPEPTDDELEDGGPSNIPAYVTLGIAGAGVVLGTVFGVQALSAKSDFDDEPTVDNADKAERNALIADMSFGVALTFGITGTVLLISNLAGGEAEEETADEASLVPEVIPYGGTKGGGAAARWTF